MNIPISVSWTPHMISNLLDLTSESMICGETTHQVPTDKPINIDAA